MKNEHTSRDSGPQGHGANETEELLATAGCWTLVLCLRDREHPRVAAAESPNRQSGSQELIILGSHG
jgi:hypothetical protein